jgi:F-type H+-transporting ATPase subunit delta
VGASRLAGDGTSAGGLAGRYALALYELADQAKQLDGVAEELRALKDTIAESEDLQRLIGNPVFSREQQSKAMATILEKAEVGDLTRRFVLVVADNRRLFALPQMIEAYLAELARRRGEITAQVTAARALSDGQQQALTDALSKSVGGKVQIDVEVDPELIGGLVVKIGSRMVDSSLRTKLQKLQLAMKGIG